MPDRLPAWEQDGIPAAGHRPARPPFRLRARAWIVASEASRLSAPTNSAGVLDRNSAGGGTLVGDQAPDPSFSTLSRRGRPVRRASSAAGPLQACTDSPLGLDRLAQHDHVSERMDWTPGACPAKSAARTAPESPWSPRLHAKRHRQALQSSLPGGERRPEGRRCRGAWRMARRPGPKGNEAQEEDLVADLRVTAAAHPHEVRLVSLVEGLLRSNPRFARLWFNGTAGPYVGDRKTIEPEGGCSTCGLSSAAQVTRAADRPHLPLPLSGAVRRRTWCHRQVDRDPSRDPAQQAAGARGASAVPPPTAPRPSAEGGTPGAAGRRPCRGTPGGYQARASAALSCQ
ncbi:MmyB family transcriptional regulator [Streptomyces mirabilis]